VDVVLEFDSVENIKKGIEVAGGVALLPEPTLRQEVEAGLLVARPLTGCRFLRPLGILYRRQHRLSPTARRFLELLLENGTGAARNHRTASRPEPASAGGPGAAARANGAAHERPGTSARRKKA
jgi:hypothetical protein